jgi:hypothetical protein
LKINDSIICTLFEGHYHYGVAALVNSLYKNGFKGNVYAGYRGSLPAWANSAKYDAAINWNENKSLSITNDIILVFLPVETTYHLTNYKPDFMLQLLEGVVKNAGAVFYFDPDIVIKCEWNFFDYWVSCGIAVVHEIMYNDMPSTHPIRNKWQSVIKTANKKVEHNLDSYVNAGFCGVAKRDISFLKSWLEFISMSDKEYGADLKKISDFSKTHAFCFIDQDSLNMALMCYPGEISEIGPDGMDFISGGYIMSHATGSPKPWNKYFFLSALKGTPPSLAEKEYWKNVEGVVNFYNGLKILKKKFIIRISSLIGRLYSKRV